MFYNHSPKQACPNRVFGLFIVLLSAWAGSSTYAEQVSIPLRAGGFAVDITPKIFPVLVNGGFLQRSTDKTIDPLHARCLVLDDGTTTLAICVVDSCMVPRELLDEAKNSAHERTGIPVDRMLISATHTHSAPSAMGALGCPADAGYVEFLPERIAEGIGRAYENLQPARIGWTVVAAPQHTNCRRWILRPDKMRDDPFGHRTVRAHMHPGYQNADFLGPAGPVDPDLSMLSVQTVDGRPLALLANYSMHYFGAPMLSADYYGRFVARFADLINADKTFVGILSQGTSGDLQWMDYSEPRSTLTLDQYVESFTRVAHQAYKTIVYRSSVSLAMAEAKLSLRRRTPDRKRRDWAEKIIRETNGRVPKSKQEVYAHEQIYLHEEPVRELKLQAIRIGELGFTAIPNEVYGITGLKIKAQSPLQPTVNIELANGSEGYIPPPEQHALGGYTTWPARTAGLEVRAEPKIVETLLTLLEKVADKPRRNVSSVQTTYASAVLASKPAAYWRLDEIAGSTSADQIARTSAIFEPGIALYLRGPKLLANAPHQQANRAPHFAGGRIKATLPDLPRDRYSVELWLCNYLPVTDRPVTGYMISRGSDGQTDSPGDHLGIGGTHSAAGKLIVFNGNKANTLLVGKTPLAPKTWHHVAFVRDGQNVAVYLDGNTTPEITGSLPNTIPPQTKNLYIGGRCDSFANFEGRIDEVAVYDRPLRPDEIAGHYAAVPQTTVPQAAIEK